MAASVLRPGGSFQCSAWLLNSRSFWAPRPVLAVSRSVLPVPCLNLTRASPGTKRSWADDDFSGFAVGADGALPSPERGSEPEARSARARLDDTRNRRGRI